MATKQGSKKAETETTEQVGRYLDALIANHGVAVDVLESARKRSLSATEKLTASLFERQREALELTKKLALNPQAYSDNAKEVLKAATDAQSRALDFAKALYKEQLDAGEEFRASAKTMAESSKDAVKAAGELARAWGANNPMGEIVKKSVEAFRSA